MTGEVLFYIVTQNIWYNNKNMKNMQNISIGCYLYIERLSRSGYTLISGCVISVPTYNFL